jgi:hypothetical protein
VVPGLSSAEQHAKKRLGSLRRNRKGSIISEPWRLALLRRRKERFPPHHDPSRKSLLAPLLRRWRPLRVSNPPVWSLDSSKNLVQSPRRTGSSLAKSRYPNHLLYGRYADLLSRQINMFRSHDVHFKMPSKSRDLLQLRKIFSNPKTKNSSSRFIMGHRKESNSFTRVKDSRYSKIRKTSSSLKSSYPPFHRQNHRQAFGFHPRIPPSDVQTTRPRRRSPCSSPKKRQQLGRPSISFLRLHKSSQVSELPIPSQKIQRSSPGLSGTKMDPDHGCSPSRLGGVIVSHPLGHDKASSRSIQQGRDPEHIQLERDLGIDSRNVLVQGPHLTRSRTHSRQDRQLHSVELSKKTWRSNPKTSTGDRSSHQIHHQESVDRHVLPHTRNPQLSCRRSFEVTEEGSRLPSFSSLLFEVGENVRTSFHRPVCFQDQLADSQICELVPGPSKHVQRRLQPEVGSREQLRVPSNPFDKEGDSEAFQLTKDLLNDSDHPLLASSHLVAEPPQTIDRNSDSHPSSSHHPERSPFVSDPPIQDGFHRLPNQQQALLADIQRFISESSTNTLRASRSKSNDDFKRFLQEFDLPEDEISLMTWIKTSVLPSTSSAQSVQNKISHIDVTRRIAGLSSFQDSPLVREFKKAVRKRLPKKTSPGFLDIFHVLRSISSLQPMPAPTKISLRHEDKKFSANFNPSVATRIRRNRLRCLFLTRSIALLRSIDCATIVRSSIRIERDFNSQKIVTFDYHGKAASIHDVEIESNYLEFLPSNPALCPASAMLLLKKQIDALNPGHDFLFCSERRPYQQLTSDRCSSIVRDFFNKIKIDDQKPHSIRKAANELLRLNGVPGTDRDARGGWKPKNSTDSPTQRLHYSYRISSFNFAEVISSALEFNSSKDSTEILPTDEQPQAAKSSG